MNIYLQQDLNATGQAPQQPENVVNNFPSSYLQSLTDGKFTIVGIVTFGIILWTISQNATGQARSFINGFLGVLLLSMLLLNWSKIRPIFFK